MHNQPKSFFSSCLFLFFAFSFSATPGNKRFRATRKATRPPGLRKYPWRCRCRRSARQASRTCLYPPALVPLATALDFRPGVCIRPLFRATSTEKLGGAYLYFVVDLWLILHPGQIEDTSLTTALFGEKKINSDDTKMRVAFSFSIGCYEPQTNYYQVISCSRANEALWISKDSYERKDLQNRFDVLPFLSFLAPWRGQDSGVWVEYPLFFFGCFFNPSSVTS